MGSATSPGTGGNYWWESDPSERYWVEIRYVEGLGRDLRCPLRDRNGDPNPWYELLDAVRPGDVVYHWNARQNGFVGKSEVAGERSLGDGGRLVPLRDFMPTERVVRLAEVRDEEPGIRSIRDQIRQAHPGRAAYYLPFQFRSDGLRMMSNYFAKLPRDVVDLLFAPSADQTDEEPALGPAGAEHSRMAYLSPFRPKSDSDYVASISPREGRRSRSHETLVNAFANWLQENGFDPLRNQAVDIGLAEPEVIFEAKTLGAGWAKAVRQAVGQLYEYRYFGVASPKAELVFVAPQAIPAHWREYLEVDRGIGCAWFDGSSFTLSPRARAALSMP